MYIYNLLSNIKMFYYSLLSNINFLEKSFVPGLSFIEIVFVIFLSLMFLIALIIILSRDVIYSLLGLIFLYVVSAVLVLSYRLEFLAFALVIVSLGAVAVLFLYVILMVNLKGYEVEESVFYKFNISTFGLGIIFMMVTLNIAHNSIEDAHLLTKGSRSTDQFGFPVQEHCSTYNGLYKVSSTPLKLYGMILYDAYFLLFVLIGIILVISLVGCILLTHDEFKKKNKK